MWLVLSIETRYFYLSIHLSICALSHLSNKYSILERRTNSKGVNEFVSFQERNLLLNWAWSLFIAFKATYQYKVSMIQPYPHNITEQNFMVLIITYILKICINFFHMFEPCLPKHFKSLFFFMLEERSAWLFSAA